MSQAQPKAPKAEKAEKAAAAPVVAFPGFEMPKFEMPKFDAAAFDLSKIEVPAQLREMADKAIEQTKEGYAKMKVAAEEVSDVVEATYTTASKGLNEFNLAALEATRVNVNSGFDHVRDLLGVKTLADVVELQSAYLRKQFEAMQGQAKDLAGIVQKTATAASEPVKASIEKTFKPAA